MANAKGEMPLLNPRELQEQEELEAIKGAVRKLAIKNLPLETIFQDIWREYQHEIYREVNKSHIFKNPEDTILVLDEVDRFKFTDPIPEDNEPTEIRLFKADSKIVFPYYSAVSGYPNFNYFVGSETEKQDLLDSILSTPLSSFSDTLMTAQGSNRIKVCQKQVFTSGYRGITLGQEVSFGFWRWKENSKTRKGEGIEGRLDHVELKYLMAEFEHQMGIDNSVMGVSFLSLWNGNASRDEFGAPYGKSDFDQRTNCIVVRAGTEKYVKDLIYIHTAPPVKEVGR